MRIWIDLANAPHVGFFLPIIRRLRGAGHDVLITLRDFNHTVEIAEEHGIRGQVVGRHGGKSDLGKIVNLAKRAVQLMRFASRWKPQVSVSHNSYTHTVAGRLLGSRVVTIMDYEGQPANHIAFRLAHRVIVPDSFPDASLRQFGAGKDRVFRYSGFKEQVYLSDYTPGAGFSDALREACGLSESWDIDENVLVTVRTPATMAAYHHFKNQIYGMLLDQLNRRTDLTVVVLPRNHEQNESIRRDFPNLKVPTRPLIGADLVYYSDVVVSAGGTMNREAAVLGTPVYTIFAGELPAVDRRLIELGRLTEIHSAGDLSKMQFKKKHDRAPLRNPALCDEIVAEILGAADGDRAIAFRKRRRDSRPSLVRRLDLFRVYYLFKGFIPRKTQVDVRRLVANAKRGVHASRWPIDHAAGRRPCGFAGWPDGKRFALVLRHDVESERGLERVPELMRLEASLGFRSAYYFVPHAYDVPERLLADLRAAGNEIGVHGWTHDGKLYLSRSIFARRAARINRQLQDWQAVGFASPSAHHNFEWLHDLDILYDTSSFDTDPFEPQPDSVSTIFPLVMRCAESTYVELPYTLPQDFTLYVILRARSAAVWEHKLDWIADKGGMAFLNTHPDYMCFEGRAPGDEEYRVERYARFLEHVLSKYEGQFWHALPREVAAFWRDTHGHAADGARVGETVQRR